MQRHYALKQTHEKNSSQLLFPLRFILILRKKVHSYVEAPSLINTLNGFAVS